MNRFLFTDWSIYDLNNPSIWETVYNRLQNTSETESDSNWDILSESFHDICMQYFLGDQQIFNNWSAANDKKVTDEFEDLLIQKKTKSIDIARFIESLESWPSFRQFLIDSNIRPTEKLSLTEGVVQFFDKIRTAKILSLTIDKIIYIGGIDAEEMEIATQHLIAKNCKLIQNLYAVDKKGEFQQIKLFSMP